jgi:hypothetical protein
MQDNISPEERLLRLIRKGPRKQAPKDIQSFANEEQQTEKPAEQQKKKSPAVSKKPGFTFSFAWCNQLLISLVLIIGVYLIIDERLEPADNIARQEPRESLSHYGEVVASRELFTASGAGTMQIRPTPTFMEMASKLRLQGIISGDNPQAIIEDSKTRQVYFLSVGGRIGDIELKQILPGKVVLTYHGQEVELTL